jgi:endoglucanase
MARRRFWLMLSVGFLLVSLGLIHGWSQSSQNAFQSSLHSPFQSSSNSSTAKLASSLAHSEAMLSRGINVTRWFSFPNNAFTSDAVGHWATEAEFKQLADVGFQHLRLAIVPSFLKEMQPPYRSLPDRLAYLDRILDWAERYKLAVIIDIHPYDPLPLQQGLSSPGYPYLQSLWQELATRYRDRPNTVLFEILNEPQVEDARTWQAIAGGLVQTIRTIDPQHTLIVPGPGWSGASDLENLRPVDDSNVVYTFHFYTPYEFTHQGGPWDESLKDLQALPYPYDAQRFQTAKRRIANPKAKERLRSFEWAKYDARKMRNDVQMAANFRRRYGVPVYCGEFGALGFTAVADDRYQWHQDLTTVLRQEAIGYALFEYRGGFGLMPDDRTDLDSRLLRAIGL